MLAYGMARLVFGMNQSLDGYVDHTAFAPGPALFRHFIEQVRGLTGSVYGRRMYEVMRYWDDDLPDWGAEERDFAVEWRSQPKWVVSRSLKSVGPNARLIEDDIETATGTHPEVVPGGFNDLYAWRVAVNEKGSDPRARFVAAPPHREPCQSRRAGGIKLMAREPPPFRRSTTDRIRQAAAGRRPKFRLDTQGIDKRA